MENMRFMIFIGYLAVGLYLINSAFSFISLPSFLLSLNKWIIAIAGVVVIFSGIGHMRSRF